DRLNPQPKGDIRRFETLISMFDYTDGSIVHRMLVLQQPEPYSAGRHFLKNVQLAPDSPACHRRGEFRLPAVT
ncbi:MAG: hypothetical protein JWN85_2448, partial [Gammaproteobacteria bacterium]|nr:hypothetical protein [Gammaproteobacteria bacterium]